MTAPADITLAPAIDFGALDWGCMGKPAYRSRGEAQNALNRQRSKRGFVMRREVKPYQCSSCELWHLGSLAL